MKIVLAEDFPASVKSAINAKLRAVGFREEDGVLCGSLELMGAACRVLEDALAWNLNLGGNPERDPECHVEFF